MAEVEVFDSGIGFRHQQTDEESDVDGWIFL